MKTVDKNVRLAMLHLQMDALDNVSVDCHLI